MTKLGLRNRDLIEVAGGITLGVLLVVAYGAGFLGLVGAVKALLRELDNAVSFADLSSFTAFVAVMAGVGLIYLVGFPWGTYLYVKKRFKTIASAVYALAVVSSWGFGIAVLFFVLFYILGLT